MRTKVSLVTLVASLIGSAGWGLRADERIVEAAPADALELSDQDLLFEAEETSRYPVVLAMVAEDDPAFAKFVDWSLMSGGLNESTSSDLADVALSMAEAERVLKREHKSGLTSARMMQKAAALAALTQDKQTLERLKNAAESSGSGDLVQMITASSAIEAPTRSAGPDLPLSQVSTDLGELTDMVTLAIHDQLLSNDKAYLLSVQKLISESDVLTEPQKSHLAGSLDVAVKATTDTPDSTDVLIQQLSGGSRGLKDVFYKDVRILGWKVMKYHEAVVKMGENYLFPYELEIPTPIGLVGVQRDNVIAERVETNEKGGWWITVRARYSGTYRVNKYTPKIQVGAERVRFYYDNGGVRVDLGGAKGVLDTKAAGAWIKKYLPKKL